MNGWVDKEKLYSDLFIFSLQPFLHSAQDYGWERQNKGAIVISFFQLKCHNTVDLSSSSPSSFKLHLEEDSEQQLEKIKE